MKSILFICALTLLILVMTPIADADLARPKTSPTDQQNRVMHMSVLQIVPDPKISDALLQIPRSELASLRAALDSAAGDTTLAASIGSNSTRTIIAGLLLFASISVAGVWFARFRGKHREASRVKKAVAAVLLGIITVGAAAVMTRGNAGPPAYYRWRNLPQSLMDGKPMSGGVAVEIVPDDPNGGNEIKLLIPLRKSEKKGDE